MNIFLNNKSTPTEARNLAELAHQLSLPEHGIAMALGTSMVPRADWESTPLKEKDNVIIIKAACGG